MCKHVQLEIIDFDEQPLFNIIYCEDCDTSFDGFGYPVELAQKEMIEQ